MSDNLRDYSENDKVAKFYKSLYENQSLENNKRLKLKYNSGCNVKMYMMDALNKLDDFIDPSDPDVSVPNSIHAYQTAERIRKKYPELYLLGFNHKDPTSDAKKYLEDDGNPYDFVGVDSDGLIALEFGVFGLPETYLINEDGKIVYKLMGPITKDILKNEIEPLL